MDKIEISAEKAISRLEWITIHELYYSDKLSKAAIDMALEALRAQQERENPQPLTLEELRERDGKPVYIGGLCRWGIVEVDKSNPYNIGIREGYGMIYAEKWLEHDSFYDYEPKDKGGD